MEIETTLKTMSLREKVGQMFMLAFAGTRLEEVRILIQDYFIGGCYISNDNASTPDLAARLTGTLQTYAGATPHKLPLLLGVDQEGAWGVMIPDSTTGPGNLALGAACDPAITRNMYQVIGEELAAVGYNTLLAPAVDVNSNPNNAIIGLRSFGERPAEVAVLAAAAVEGTHAAGILATAKHFPGHGDTHVDSHRGLPRVDRSLEELNAIDLLPFQAAVDAGVDIMMTSHIIYPAVDPLQPATMSVTIIQDILRVRMGFKGLILSDSMNMGAIRQNYTPDRSAIMAVQAGIDMIMLAEEHYDHDVAHYLEKQKMMIDAVITAVERGEILIDRIDDAVRHILSLKLRPGLPVGPKQGGAELVGNPAHRDIEQAAANAAVCVLQDNGGFLPLETNTRLVLVNATERKSYDVLTNTRGIGPNQTEPAFDVFHDELLRLFPKTVVFEAKEVLATDELPDELSEAEKIVVVLENYPIPGMDFDKNSQSKVVERLRPLMEFRGILVALSDPYLLSPFKWIGTQVCTNSSRPCGARAATAVLAGSISARGTFPVSF